MHLSEIIQFDLLHLTEEEHHAAIGTEGYRPQADRFMLAPQYVGTTWEEGWKRVW